MFEMFEPPPDEEHNVILPEDDDLKDLELIPLPDLPGLTSGEHFFGVALRAPQGYKHASEEACFGMESILKEDPLPPQTLPDGTTTPSPRRYEHDHRFYTGAGLDSVPAFSTPPLHRYGAVRFFKPMLTVPNYTNCQEIAVDCINLERGGLVTSYSWRVLETGYVTHVHRWARHMLEEAEDPHYVELINLPTNLAENWSRQPIWKKLKALTRLHEIIYAFFRTIRDDFEEEKVKELERYYGEFNDRVDQESFVRQHEMIEEQRFEEEMLGLLVSEEDPLDKYRAQPTWSSFAEFAEQLARPQAHWIRPYFERLMQLHVGVSVDYLASREFKILANRMKEQANLPHGGSPGNDDDQPPKRKKSTSARTQASTSSMAASTSTQTQAPTTSTTTNSRTRHNPAATITQTQAPPSGMSATTSTDAQASTSGDIGANTNTNTRTRASHSSNKRSATSTGTERTQSNKRVRFG